MKLTDHFTQEEFTHTSRAEFQAENINQAGIYGANILAVAVELEKLRVFINCPVVISSGFRCPELNKAVGGSNTSQHLTGSAVDFTVEGYSDSHGLEFIFEWCKNHTDYGQLILERPAGKTPWIHLGLPRDGKPRTRFMFDGKEYKPV